MGIIKSSLLDTDQKVVLKDAILLYVTNLQKKYFRDNMIDESLYTKKMQEIQQLVETLLLKDG